MSNIKRRLCAIEKKVFRFLPKRDDELWDKKPIACYAFYVVLLDYQKAHPQDFSEEDIAATKKWVSHGEALLPELKQDRNDPAIKGFYEQLDEELDVLKLVLPEAIRKVIEQNKAKENNTKQ